MSCEVNRSYRFALARGAFPLLVGISVFVLWFLTRWTWLMYAGVCTLYGGVALVLVGVIALARFCWLAFRTPGLPRRHIWLPTLACSALLLLNFPVASGFIAAVIKSKTSYTVVIRNDSQKPLTDVRVFGGGFDVTWSSIPPGGTVKQSIWIQHDDSLKFRAHIGTTVHTETIVGYVTPGMGAHPTVTINPDDTISVTRDHFWLPSPFQD